jgi:YesN/AraC family two-component response regulator
MMVIHPKTFCVIPPFHMHKTEGGAFVRININISPKLLSKDEISFLESCAEKLALKMDNEYCDICIKLLQEASNIQWEWKNNDEYKLALTKSILYLLQKQTLTAVPASSSAESRQSVDTLMLNIASYINENYALPITRKTLCEKFFVSKGTLSERFKRTMNCSVTQYLLRVRIGKARELLIKTDKPMEEIAELIFHALKR